MIFRDEFAKFLIKSRKLISNDTAILRITTPMLPGSWGEDLVPFSRFPKSFCVLVGRQDDPNQMKPYTPIDCTADHMDLMVKTYPLGRISKYLFGLKEGDTVLLKGPREKLNLFELFANRKPKRIIALAAGTGIAPIYQVLKYMESNGIDIPINLVYANKSFNDILLKPDLEALHFKHFVMNHVLESERRTETDNGYIKLEDIPGASQDVGDYVLVCGPVGFNNLLLGMQDTPGLLNLKSYTKDQIYKF